LVEVLNVGAFCFWNEYLVFFLHNLPTTINFDHNLNTIQVFSLVPLPFLELQNFTYLHLQMPTITPLKIQGGFQETMIQVGLKAKEQHKSQLVKLFLVVDPYLGED
jgi:hypothetical protein